MQTDRGGYMYKSRLMVHNLQQSTLETTSLSTINSMGSWPGKSQTAIAREFSSDFCNHQSKVDKTS